jgi:hypothetical protein
MAGFFRDIRRICNVCMYFVKAERCEDEGHEQRTRRRRHGTGLRCSDVTDRTMFYPRSCWTVKMLLPVFLKECMCLHRLIFCSEVTSFSPPQNIYTSLHTGLYSVEESINVLHHHHHQFIVRYIGHSIYRHFYFLLFSTYLIISNLNYFSSYLTYAHFTYT